MRRFILAINILAPLACVTLIAVGQHLLAGLGILIIAHALWLAATLIPNCGWWGEVVTSFGTSRRDVWLTIDDGPDENETHALLDLLEAHQAKATFFFIGKHAEKLPALVAEVVSRGSEVANHTQHHDAGVFWSFGARRTADEVKSCSDVLQKFTGKKPHWFRAPAGLRNHHLHPVLKNEGLRLAGWTARGFDGVRCEPAVAFERIKKNVRPGAIILIHERRGTAVTLLRSLLEWLDAEGYRCVIPDRGTGL